MTGPVSWSFTTASRTTNATIWSSTATPANPSANDTGSVELGVKFRSDVAGYITGIRFYKGAGNTGTHVGHLWTSTGTLLATATFTGETATGWQQVTSPPPWRSPPTPSTSPPTMPPRADYADDCRLLRDPGVDNGPLHALSDAGERQDGVYAYGRPGRSRPVPTDATNYWVDVVFTPNQRRPLRRP